MDRQPYFHDLPLKKQESQTETRGGLPLPNQGTSPGVPAWMDIQLACWINASDQHQQVKDVSNHHSKAIEGYLHFWG